MKGKCVPVCLGRVCNREIVHMLQMAWNFFRFECEPCHVNRRVVENAVGSLRDFATRAIPGDNCESKLHDKHCVPSHGKSGFWLHLFFFFFNNPVFINKLRDNETRPLKGRGQHENQKLG